MGPIGRIVQRLLAIADDASDYDDLRLRKRVGMAAGAITVVAPFADGKAAWHPRRCIGELTPEALPTLRFAAQAVPGTREVHARVSLVRSWLHSSSETAPCTRRA